MTMTSTTTTAPAPLSRDDAGTLLGQTMGLVALTAGLFALGAYIGRERQADGVQIPGGRSSTQSPVS